MNNQFLAPPSPDNSVTYLRFIGATFPGVRGPGIVDLQNSGQRWKESEISKVRPPQALEADLLSSYTTNNTIVTTTVYNATILGWTGESDITEVDKEIISYARHFVFAVGGSWGASRLVNWSHMNPKKVAEFLQRYSSVKSLMRDMEPSLARIFGVDVAVSLQVVSYPEEGTEDELIASIRSSDTVELGLKKLEELDEEWADKIWSVSRGRFFFDIVFP